MVVSKWTRREVRALRVAALRFTQEKFAEYMGYTASGVAKWERASADRSVRGESAQDLDSAFAKLNREQRARFDAALEESEASLRTDQQTLTQPGGPAAGPSAREVDELRRREFGAAIIGLPVLARDNMTLGKMLAHMGTMTGARVAPELVEYFRTQLGGHYTADMYLGPLYLIPTVEAQTELIIVLVREADTAVRRRLLETGTAYAALLGWLYQDAGNLTASAKWRATTLSLAHRCGDPQMISYALSNMSMLALDQGDGRAVVDYAQAALAAGRELSPKARVIALQHEAQGYAMLGDRGKADGLLDSVASLIGQVDDEHPWGNSCRRTPHHVEVQRATCYGRTGDVRDAVHAAALWDEVIDSMPASARRDNAVFRARQSAVLARIPDPDRAVWAASEAADAVTATGSARLRGELKSLPSHAHSWEHTSAGRELRTLVGSIA